jgi:hypothetical protein
MVPPPGKFGSGPERNKQGSTAVLPPFLTTAGIWGATENIYSLRVFPPLTHSRHSPERENCR